tara:strand:+ start:557 stop:1117 length:561 start_codon:yes stop_codon:yes gene_type:complete
MDNVTSIKKKLNNPGSKQKSFGTGMYGFLMFMIDYYRRVRSDLKMDFDSFIIIQIVVSHEVYIMQSENSKTYSEISDEFSKISKAKDIDDSFLIFKAKELMSKIQRNKLTVSSICQVSTLPKETVRRKVRTLVARKILSQNKSEGVLVGPAYKNIFDETVPKTTMAFAKLIKKWKQTGVLDNLLSL